MQHPENAIKNLSTAIEFVTSAKFAVATSVHSPYIGRLTTALALITEVRAEIAANAVKK